MERLNFDKIAVYDYAENFYKWHENQIREKFLSTCINDTTLSEEFKKHISNQENVEVHLYPQYGYDIFLELGNVYVDYSYDYTFTCSTSATITGELTYNSSSNSYQANNVNVSKNYSSSDYTHHGNTAFYSSKYERCLVHLGTARFNKADLKHYKNVKGSSNMPSELKDLSERTWSYEDINKLLKISSLPEEVRVKLKKRALEFSIGSNQRNFSLDKITDYRIEDSALILCPSGCPFTISVKYKGKNYSTKFDNVSDITSMGETSTHYDDFTEDIKNALIKYSPKKWASNVIYLITCLLSGFCALTLFIMMVGCKAFGHEGLKYQGYDPLAYQNGNTHYAHFIIFIIILIVLFIVSIVKKCGKEVITANNSLYDTSLSSFTLRNKIDSYYRKKRNNCVKKSVIYLIIVSILCGGIMGYSSYVWKITDNQNYWYTPEIINTYSYKDDDFPSEWTFESCDKNGNVIAIYSRNSFQAAGGPWGTKGWYCQKAKYSGKITEKADGKIVIDLIFVEMIEYHKLGYPREDFTIKLTENCTKLHDGIDAFTIKNS